MKSVRISEICGRYFRNLYFENKQAEIRAIANENTVLNALIISIFSLSLHSKWLLECVKRHTLLSLHPIYTQSPIVSMRSLLSLLSF